MKILLLNLGFGELFLVALVYLIFFGSKNLPSVMKDLGRLLFKVKNSVKEIYQDFSIEDEK